MDNKRFLQVNIEYDPERISAAEITDSLNENFHAIALDKGMIEDEPTGGYEGLDWSYIIVGAE